MNADQLEDGFPSEGIRMLAEDLEALVRWRRREDAIHVVLKQRSQLGPARMDPAAARGDAPPIHHHEGIRHRLAGRQRGRVRKRCGEGIRVRLRPSEVQQGIHERRVKGRTEGNEFRAGDGALRHENSPAQDSECGETPDEALLDHAAERMR